MVIPDRPFIAPFIYGFLLFGWFCAIVLSPLYIFDSGLPQPSDILLIGICGLCLCFYMAARKIILSDITVTLTLIVILFAAINAIYGAYYGDVRFYYSAAYYVFNAVVFAGTVILFLNHPHRMHRIAMRAVYASVILEILFIVLTDAHTSYRVTGSFNNPNQLGYWALLNAATLMALHVKTRLTLSDFIIFCLCALMVVMSLSRAAMAGFVVLLSAVFFSRQLSVMFKSMLACVMAFAIIAILIVPTLIPDMSFNTDMGGRLSWHDPDNDFIAERGYDRIIDQPQYLLYGAGEGAYWRFSDDTDTGLELHSGIATILFSYGIFGAILFFMFLYAVLRHSPPVILCGVVAVMIYGLTHQNIRFTGFWIYLAVIYAMTTYRNNTPRDNTAHA